MSLWSRREMLGSAAVVGGWLMFGPRSSAQTRPAESEPASGPYHLPPLPYDYADLEPFIDAQTVKLHHDIHHAGYVRGANAALADLEQVRRQGGDAIKQVRAITDALSFNFCGHVLHDVYWKSMKKSGGGDPPAASDIGRLIIRDFGSLDAFRGNLAAAAVQVQGSGWAVLAYEPLAQRLVVLQAEKHQNTAVWGAVPLLTLDVWEHAYYLKYQNKRPDYVKAFMELIDWDSVNTRLTAATKLG